LPGVIPLLRPKLQVNRRKGEPGDRVNGSRADPIIYFGTRSVFSSRIRETSQIGIGP